MSNFEDSDSESPIHAPMALTAQQRQILLNSHPVLERGYCLPTPMLEYTYRLVRDYVWTKRTGIYFYGTPRLGKSTCAEEIKFLINEEFPQAYVVLVSIVGTMRNSESHMFRQILEAEKHALADRTSPHVLLKNLKTDIIFQVHRRQGKQFVLILDEMHLLTDMDLQQLLVLHNALALEKIKMTTVAFAQPEILHRVTGLMTKNQRQIIGRFLSRPHPFKGCSSLQELLELLKGYDENSEFPENSGWSYTRFFLPEAYENGFRLYKFAASIWEKLCEAAGTKDGDSIPMEHLCLTIEHLLTASRRFDCATFTLSGEDIGNAVDASDLKNFTSLMIEEVS